MQAPQLHYSANLEDLKDYFSYCHSPDAEIIFNNRFQIHLLKLPKALVLSKGECHRLWIYSLSGSNRNRLYSCMRISFWMNIHADFFADYSPERINPGEKKHRVINILKITSGSTLEITNVVNQF